ncbi:DUF3298 and DUF4163 domain-containing protein [Romboutsia lituseburensis]|uniref:DUF3298 and DUF4163 domain-containing protein n=1 Tax=Romboutsia lituseburensis TaxID=1537 RepID=UPI00215A80F3|nr:DUF3298 and DUF4163 domain-containing protein [Romboutsia lituseburensis]MCR8743825.1 DUF3298 and DUF4163 domain-containing protein [Romboutsia lituseburensis]
MRKIKPIACLSLITILLSTSFSYANFDKNIIDDKAKCTELPLFKSKQSSINNIFTIEMKKIDENKEFFKSDIHYPNLKIKNKYLDDKNSNIKFIENINEAISNYIDDFKKKIEEESKEYEKQYKTIFYKAKDQYVKYQYEAYSDYQVTYNKNNLISIPIKLYEFTGGAHGMSYLKSFNYDLENKKELKLKDLFKENVNYKKIVNKFINDEISKNKDIYFTGDEGFKGISDNQSFYIDNEGIVVYFGLYEIAPYYVGIPKFKLTWDEFGKYLKYNK